MAENTKIEWTDHTFNPWRGCTKVSAGCAHCYAETLSGRNPGTLGVWGPNGTRVVAAESQWKLPLKWNREAEVEARFRTINGIPVERPRVFCASLADVLEDWPGPMVDAQGRTLYTINGAEWFTEGEYPECRPLTMSDVRARLFRLIYATPNLDYLLLTKRIENAARMMGPDGVGLYAHANGPVPCPQPNIWIGTSVENQAAADERIPHLLRTPAAVRFLSCEPLLGPVDLKLNKATPGGIFGALHWVIVGGESGPGARPCNVEWVRSIVKQCKDAAVPCFVKQLGRTVTDSGCSGEPFDGSCGHGKDPFSGVHHLRLRDKKGGDMSEWPLSLRVREFPTVKAEVAA